MGKTRGLGAGRKLRNVRKEQRWHDVDFKKRYLGTQWKKPFGGASHAKGIVLEKIGIEAKQPNSAIRKCVRVQLIKNGKKIACFVPGDGCLNFVDENDEVLIAGAGRSGHSVGDLPGVRFKVVKVSGVSLVALYRRKKVCCLLFIAVSHCFSPHSKLLISLILPATLPPSVGKAKELNPPHQSKPENLLII